MTGPGSMAGPVRLFVRHPTASNLLMAVMVVLGLFGVVQLNTQFFPTMEIPSITVQVTWSGASAEDVEENILDALEPALRFLDDVEEVRSVAREGIGVITIEFTSQADMAKALGDVQEAVDGVTTLPDDAEQPKVQRHAFFEAVAKLALSGPFSEQALKEHAKRLRDGLLAAGIDKVTLTGARDEEIWVRVREADLRRLDLTLGDIAERVRNETRDLPSGILEGDVELQLRALAERKTPQTLSRIEIKSAPGGEKVFLGDIADVETRFDRDQPIGQQEGIRAIELSVQRAASADTLKTMELLDDYLAEALPELPPTLKVRKYDVRGKFVAQRLGILVKNGLQGLALVLIILFIFLDARVAFWVAAGIPVAVLATLAVMWGTGQSINMVSMFALIMMLGIIVDDAIVVGEHTATLQARGQSRLEAAEGGAVRMLAPVIAATLTTMAAFYPIFLVRDRIGDVMEAIPLVVISVLIASTIECFLILPGHLRHGFGKINRTKPRLRAAIDDAIARFRDGPFRRVVQLAYAWRYTTVAVALALLLVSLGLIAGGRVGFNFFPAPESENITASVTFAPGTPREEQRRAVGVIEAALGEAEKALARDERLVENGFTTLGVSGRNQGDNLAQIEVQLTPNEERQTPTRELIAAWRKAVPPIPGVDEVTIVGRRGGPPGRDIDIELQDAPVAQLKAAALELRRELTRFPGLSAIDDDLPYGRQEVILEVTPRGAAAGFTAQSVGQQVRDAFQGAVATKFARRDEEITVRVKRVQEVSGTHALRQIYLRSPTGRRVPLTEVVKIREKAGFSVIQRRDGRRAVAVTADLDPNVANTADVIASLDATVMPELKGKYGFDYAYRGREEERLKSFADLKLGALLSLVLIYIILAWVFASYAKPLAVMSIIPFGLVGAVLGHLIMGFPLTIISMIGLLGLSGILVNDSIILVSQVAQRRAQGDDLEMAAVGAAQDRLRAVLLTSLTTIGGLLPLMFETSTQAQFLIPMAVTLVFGLAAATVLVLVLVPSLMGIGGDLGALAGEARKGLARAHADLVKRL